MAFFLIDVTISFQIEFHIKQQVGDNLRICVPNLQII